MSKRYSLNKDDAKSLMKVFAWTIVSASVGFIIATIPAIDVPPQYAAITAAIIPVVNSGLVALKKFIDERID
jgi:hypothetical protein